MVDRDARQVIAGERQVALLRGVNIGRAKRVAMADLRRIVERLGYEDVRTLLNSGNVVYTARRVPLREAADRIQRALLAELGLSSRVFVLDRSQIDTIVRENLLAHACTNPSRMFTAVLGDEVDRERLRALAARDWSPDEFAVGRLAAYYWCPEGLLTSKLPAALGKVTGAAATARNWATTLKLQSLLS